MSIKTQQAARLILNQILEDIHRMRSEGVLDDIESQKLEVVSVSTISMQHNNRYLIMIM